MLAPDRPKKRRRCGELGTPHLFQAVTSTGARKPEDAWQSRPEERPLGGMTGLGVHMIDNLQYLAGRAKRVSAFSRTVDGATGLEVIAVLEAGIRSAERGTAMDVDEVRQGRQGVHLR